MSDSNWPSAFVTKFSPDGSSLVYSTYLGGNGSGLHLRHRGGFQWRCLCDRSDNFSRFPDYRRSVPDHLLPGTGSHIGAARKSPQLQRFYDASAFVTKLNPAGTGLVYSTFLGGIDGAIGTAIAVDAAGNAYIAGNEQEYCSARLYVIPAFQPPPAR